MRIQPQTGFGGRVWASTTNSADGKYRLGVGNGEGTTNTTTQFLMDLELGIKATSNPEKYFRLFDP
jgi:hypothetical protein